MLRRPPTGGGPKATQSPYTDSILDIIGINSPIIEGRPKLCNYIYEHMYKKKPGFARLIIY